MVRHPPSAGEEAAESSSPAFALDESIGFLVYRAQLTMKKELARQFRPHHITPERWAVLSRLWEKDGQTQNELAERTFKDGPTITRICARLEDKGLVIRRPQPGDGRALLVSLSDEAHELVPELIPRALKTINRALSGVDADEAAIAKRVLCRMFENLA